VPYIETTSLIDRIRSHPLFLLIVGIAIIIGMSFVAGQISVVLYDLLGNTDWTELLSSAIAVALAVAGYWLFALVVERKPLADFALAGAGREWLLGAAIGFGVMSLVIGVIALGGGYRIAGYNGAHVLIKMLAIAITSGVIEEILLRGLFFRMIEKWLGSWTALILSAALFGFAHIANPNSSVLAAVAIALEAGILLAAIYMWTRRLWAAIGLHMAWNFAQGGIYGVAVSGFEIDGVIRPIISGPELLTGGAFGAEASLPAIVICTAVGLYFLYRAHAAGQFVGPSWYRFKTGEAAPAVA
jgi:membrane protease YdiL (CAAX protease family)